DWIYYKTPSGESGWDHLIATNLQRMTFAVTVQGIVLMLLGPLIAPRMTSLGVTYLLLASFTRFVRSRYGVRTAYRATYVVSMALLLPLEMFTGGVYSYAVMSVVLLTIAASVAFEIRTTLLLLGGHAALLGVMSVFQIHGLWVE